MTAMTGSNAINAIPLISPGPQDPKLAGGMKYVSCNLERFIHVPIDELLTISPPWLKKTSADCPRINRYNIFTNNDSLTTKPGSRIKNLVHPPTEG